MQKYTTNDLYNAINKGNVEKMKTILNTGLKPDGLALNFAINPILKPLVSPTIGISPLYNVPDNKTRTTMAKILLDAGAPIKKKTTLHLAVHNDLVEIVKILINKNTLIDKEILTTAAQNDSQELVRVLLKANAPMETTELIKRAGQKTLPLIVMHFDIHQLLDLKQDIIQKLPIDLKNLITWIKNFKKSSREKTVPEKITSEQALEFALLTFQMPRLDHKFFGEFFNQLTKKTQLINAITQRPYYHSHINEKILTALATHVSSNMNQQEAQEFLKIDQNSPPLNIKNTRVALMQKLYLLVKHYNLKEVGTFIRRSLTTIANTPPDIGSIIASFEPSDNPLVSPSLPKRELEDPIDNPRKKTKTKL